MSMEPWRVGLEQGDGGCDGQVQGDPGLGTPTANTVANIVMWEVSTVVHRECGVTQPSNATHISDKIKTDNPKTTTTNITSPISLTTSNIHTSINTGKAQHQRAPDGELDDEREGQDVQPQHDVRDDGVPILTNPKKI